MGGNISLSYGCLTYANGRAIANMYSQYLSQNLWGINLCNQCTYVLLNHYFTPYSIRIEIRHFLWLEMSNPVSSANILMILHFITTTVMLKLLGDSVDLNL